MANQWVNIYKNNPTAGATDGTAVSTDGTFTAPMTFVLDASVNEEQAQKMAIRTETGYIARDVTLSDSNDTNDRLKLCKTENGTYADSITFDEITDTNTIFYVKASSDSSENPQTDRSVGVHFLGAIASV